MSEPLKLVIPDPQRNVVEMLEEKLAQAKAGKVQGVVMLCLEDTKEFVVGMAGFKTNMDALGALELLKSGFLKHIWRD